MQVQGSKKVLSSCPGQVPVDFPVGQVTFHSHLPNGQVVCQLNRKKSNLRLVQGKQNLRATCPKGKLEFKFFFSPEVPTNLCILQKTNLPVRVTEMFDNVTQLAKLTDFHLWCIILIYCHGSSKSTGWSNNED